MFSSELWFETMDSFNGCSVKLVNSMFIEHKKTKHVTKWVKTFKLYMKAFNSLGRWTLPGAHTLGVVDTRWVTRTLENFVVVSTQLKAQRLYSCYSRASGDRGWALVSLTFATQNKIGGRNRGTHKTYAFESRNKQYNNQVWSQVMNPQLSS
jgi:hypothetical protein